MNKLTILTQKKSLLFAITFLAIQNIATHSYASQHTHTHHNHHHTSFDSNHQLNIVTSIAPLQSLVKNVVGDKHQVSLLIKEKSVHIDYLKPSQLGQIVDADLVIYLHNALEVFIANLPQSTLTNNKRIEIARYLQTPLLPLNTQAGYHQEHDEHEEHEKHHDDEEHDKHDEHEEHEKHHDDEEHDKHDEHEEHAHHKHHSHDHSFEFDLHFWLDPIIAMQIVDIIATKLSELHPGEAVTFKNNAKAYKRTLQKLHTTIQKHIANTADTKFLVFHNAYAYFIHRYGLTPQLVASEHLLMSLKEVAQLKADIANNQYACAIIDEEHSSRNIKKLLANTELPLLYLNPIGLDFMDSTTSSKNLYQQLLTSIATTFSQCLK